MDWKAALVFGCVFGVVLITEAAPAKPTNPFDESSGEYSSTETAASAEAEGDSEEYEDDSGEANTRPPIIIPRILSGGVTPAPIRQNIMYTLLPTLQKKTYKYCPYNQYTFMTTCKPGKKIRYDLQVFCQEYSQYCGVPNIHLYPARQAGPEWHPEGYGQKQKNGNLGLGKSFGFGLGMMPGFEVVSSSGADIANVPGLQFGGLMFNSGTDLGVMGERIGKSPARTTAALDSGYPSFGLDPNTKAADERAANAALRAIGIPPVPGLAKALGKLNNPTGRKGKLLFEPGFDAVDKNAPVATGRTDGESVNLPAGLGKVELLNGVGMGIGKK
uniref:Secreted protein n=1 Tax=Panagrellus redivivus TaxID=6233 RepID=A0A7E4UN85_PANRE